MADLKDKDKSQHITYEEIKDHFLQWTDKGTVLDDVMLIDSNSVIKDLVKRVIEEHKKGKKLREYNLKPTNTILFTGAPGLGKTYLAKALHTEMNIPLYILDVGELLKSGSGLSAMNKIFQFVNDPMNQPCILFMDECDGIFKSREDPNVAESTKQLTNLIMQNLQEINDDLNSELIIIAASNYKDQLDDATLTRFQIQCTFNLPENYKPFIIMEVKRNKMFNLIDDVEDDIMESCNNYMRDSKFSIRELNIKIDYAFKTAVLEDKMGLGDVIDIKLSTILNLINQHINFGLVVESVNKNKSLDDDFV